MISQHEQEAAKCLSGVHKSIAFIRKLPHDGRGSYASQALNSSGLEAAILRLVPVTSLN